MVRRERCPPAAVTEGDPMAWAYLALAGLFEVGFASTLKLTEGFTRLWPTLAFLFCAVTSFVLLAKAAQSLPIGTAYAVWTGIGAAGTVIIGILLYKEPATALRLFFIATLIGSIIGLRYSSPS
jgi:quaternary ammonium compound-resistance protein SugE